ncbi:hypothetical protein L1887_01137 [Cichorium endivia]|nr:hypothetical protein L1887_01137 [Cichorium endivia]
MLVFMEKVIRWALNHQFMYSSEALVKDYKTSNESIEYGINILKDMVTENKFEKRLFVEVILPNDIGVTFDDTRALESVKYTLKELVIFLFKDLSYCVK